MGQVALVEWIYGQGGKNWVDDKVLALVGLGIFFSFISIIIFSARTLLLHCFHN
jgi:hypothetical protein